MSPAQTAKTLAHELGHIMLDHVADFAEYAQHKGRAETEAESFAFMVSAHFGLDSAAYSAPYITSWAGTDPDTVLKAVQETGDAVLKAFRAFLKDTESPQDEQDGAAEGQMVALL
jgi:antirestriction protein ArdC